METRIYGTIGPACCDTDKLVHLFEKGMTGIRINLSHSCLEEASGWIQNIHTAWQRCAGKLSGPEILMDLRGPELRVGKLSASRKLKENDRVILVPENKNNLFDPVEVPVPSILFSSFVRGQEVLLDDGKLLLCVGEVLSGTAECSVIRGGILKSAKSIALPDADVYPPTLTDSDLINIGAAAKYGITGVMLPFVRNKEDLLNLKHALRCADAENIRVFAKIENLDGVGRLPELFPYCEEIVIARGDLGNAMPLWKLPVVQAQIAQLCKAHHKPFMVVTQMLASMENAAVPTRAEVSDIFRAVKEGAASVMVTGETAAGKYPVEVMEYLANTVRETEQYLA